MYWIEVYFANGKTLRKESNNINGVYQVYNRYCCKTLSKKHAVQKVKAGRDELITLECDHMDLIAL